MAAALRTALDRKDRALLDEERRGHLATATPSGRPHVVPVCYAVLDERTLVFAVDGKPKAPGRELRRLRNLRTNDRFALVVDRWSERWDRLAWVLIEGRGRLVEEEGRREEAVQTLRARYPQYAGMDLRAEIHPVVELRVERVRRWSGGAD